MTKGTSPVTISVTKGTSPVTIQITPAALSYHLKLLKGADLIAEYKEKNFIYYEINTTVFDELIMWVNQFGGKKE